MRFWTRFLLIFLVAQAFADDYVVMAPNFVPHGVVAKQIAPGTSRIISLTTTFAFCDSCEIWRDASIIESLPEKKDVDGSAFRFEVSLFDLTWPKTKNTDGANNWTGHNFGGGIFLNAHYGFWLEGGLSPMIVQWFGPFYLAAAYQFSFGRYYGHDADDEVDSDINENKFMGATNLGGGAMAFMNNHGLAFGAHGGIRDCHIINPGDKHYTSYDSYAGRPVSPAFRGGYQIDKWVAYYGVDFVSYTNLPLLAEADYKWHTAFLLSFEVGLKTGDNPVSFWSLVMSFMI